MLIIHVIYAAFVSKHSDYLTELKQLSVRYLESHFVGFWFVCILT